MDYRNALSFKTRVNLWNAKISDFKRIFIKRGSQELYKNVEIDVP